MKTKQLILGGRAQVKVAIAQISSQFLNREACITRAVEAIREAASNGAELVVFPEVWLAGYPYWTEGWDSNMPEWVNGRVRFHDAAVLIPSEDTERLANAARDNNTHVVMGCNEMDSRPGAQTIYNTLLFIGREGNLLGKHRKLIPTFTERMFWGQGDGRDLVVFETDIGRIGGLICGENLMTTARAAMAAQGEHIHIAVFPGSFALHTGPQLEEPDKAGYFWGNFAARAHAMEAGTFVIQACSFIDEKDIPDDFPYKGKMNTSYAHGGSAIISPLGVPLVEPQYGSQIIYGELQADMIKAVKAILDSVGHYDRPDVLRLLVRRERGWESADTPVNPQNIRWNDNDLRRAADQYDIDESLVYKVVEDIQK
ncbi:MAG: carbon-nitrogen hydrolase family protein [Pseudomonadales bacterium]|nr:carbon-nitrogen hydrolase family protein [Pseudomonadales bacterium]MCP5216466.1 carbon-nitrogen hydrolase family protein [Pseudomonadales bacterium]